jgi:hypothetical protein
MKKTLIIASILSTGLSLADGVTLHDTAFDTVIDFNNTPIQNTYSPTTNYNFYIKQMTGTQVYVNVSAIKGIYLEDGAGLKINNSNRTTVTYLYIPTGTLMCVSTNNAANQINWSSTGSGMGFTMSNTTGAWVDINGNYGTHINTASMANGSVYLNTLGSLSSTLATTNHVYATALTSFDVLKALTATSDSGYTLTEQTNGLTTVTRTLFSGNFSSWTDSICTSNITINGLDTGAYTLLGNSSGLFLTYSIPEPATAGLTLLGLLGFSLRHRRH